MSLDIWGIFVSSFLNSKNVNICFLVYKVKSRFQTTEFYNEYIVYTLQNFS